MQQDMLDSGWEYKPKVGKLYLNLRDWTHVPKAVLESLIIWVEWDEPENEERDRMREIETVFRLRKILAEHKGETYCQPLGRWLRTSPKVGVGGSAYLAVFGVHLATEQKEFVEKGVELFGVDIWADVLLDWRAHMWNPNNIHGMLSKARMLYQQTQRSELPVVGAVDPIFLEPEENANEQRDVDVSRGGVGESQEAQLP